MPERRLTCPVRMFRICSALGRRLSLSESRQFNETVRLCPSGSSQFPLTTLVVAERRPPGRRQGRARRDNSVANRSTDRQLLTTSSGLHDAAQSPSVGDGSTQGVTR